MNETNTFTKSNNPHNGQNFLRNGFKTEWDLHEPKLGSNSTCNTSILQMNVAVAEEWGTDCNYGRNLSRFGKVPRPHATCFVLFPPTISIYQ